MFFRQTILRDTSLKSFVLVGMHGKRQLTEKKQDPSQHGLHHISLQTLITSFLSTDWYTLSRAFMCFHHPSLLIALLQRAKVSNTSSDVVGYVQMRRAHWISVSSTYHAGEYYVLCIDLDGYQTVTRRLKNREFSFFSGAELYPIRIKPAAFVHGGSQENGFPENGETASSHWCHYPPPKNVIPSEIWRMTMMRPMCEKTRLSSLKLWPSLTFQDIETSHQLRCLSNFLRAFFKIQ